MMFFFLTILMACAAGCFIHLAAALSSGAYAAMGGGLVACAGFMMILATMEKIDKTRRGE